MLYKWAHFRNNIAHLTPNEVSSSLVLHEFMHLKIFLTKNKDQNKLQEELSMVRGKLVKLFKRTVLVGVSDVIMGKRNFVCWLLVWSSILKYEATFFEIRDKNWGQTTGCITRALNSPCLELKKNSCKFELSLNYISSCEWSLV